MPASRPNPWLALTGVAIASFLGCIDFTIVNTALPALGQELGIALGVLLPGYHATMVLLAAVSGAVWLSLLLLPRHPRAIANPI